MKNIHLITHHWSDNYLKGFHIYNKIDKLLGEKKLNFEFTFIGRYNKKYKPKHINLISPKSDMELANLLRQHDIYLTATQNEPCGMHHIEGMSCGLPLLYCKGGGGILEAGVGCSEQFKNIKTMLNAIEKIKNNYNNYVEKIDYKYLSSDRCYEEYYKIIKTAFEN